MKWRVSLICAFLLAGCAVQQKVDQVSTSSDAPATAATVQEKVIAVASKSPSEQLREAMWKGESHLLPQLLEAGADPNFRDPDQKRGCNLSAVDVAIRKGNLGALDLLLAHGGRIDPMELVLDDRDTCAPLGLAIRSRDEAMVHRISSLMKVPLSKFCMSDDSELVSTFLKTTDSFWGMLIREGFGNPSTDSKSCAGLAPMSERLVLALMEVSVSYNTSLVGWQSERLNARLKDLWRPAVASGVLSQKRVEALRQVASDRRRDDILRALEKASARNPPSALRQDKALRTKLPGEYRLLDSSETTATVVLKVSGKFKYSGVQSGREFQVEGSWSVRNGRVLFNTDEARRASGWVPFKRQLFAKGEPLPEGDDPTLIYVNVFFGGYPAFATSVMVVGCESPEMVAGITWNEGWSGRINGKACQIVLERPGFDGGRSFVYTVPQDEDPVLSRYFLFELQPTGGRFDFNHEMSVENGELVLRDMEEEYHFARQ